MSPDVKLEISGAIMRPLDVGDVHEEYVNGLNLPEINRFLDAVKKSKQTVESVTNFICDEALSTNSVLWGIWPLGSDRHVGTVRIHSIDFNHGIACIGVCLFDTSAWGKGLASAAIRAVTKWSMRTYSLRWVEAGAYEANVASQHAFLSAGYEWVFDIRGKYLFEGGATTVKVYAARVQETDKANFPRLR